MVRRLIMNTPTYLLNTQQDCNEIVTSKFFSFKLADGKQVPLCEVRPIQTLLFSPLNTALIQKLTGRLL